MATFIRIAPNLRAILAAQLALKLVDRRVFRPTDEVERDGLIDIAAEASNLEIAKARVERTRPSGH
jgi:hypothetical protein